MLFLFSELMAGFQMSSKSRSPGRKSPHNEMNGYGYCIIEDLIFEEKFNVDIFHSSVDSICL